MGTQLKRSTSLNDARQERLAEIAAAEPLVSLSQILALGVDAIYALWRRAGRDLKAAIGAIGAELAPEGAR